jgi:hypothetical protein
MQKGGRIVIVLGYSESHSHALFCTLQEHCSQIFIQSLPSKLCASNPGSINVQILCAITVRLVHGQVRAGHILMAMGAINRQRQNTFTTSVHYYVDWSVMAFGSLEKTAHGFCAFGVCRALQRFPCSSSFYNTTLTKKTFIYGRFHFWKVASRPTALAQWAGIVSHSNCIAECLIFD